MGGPANEDQVQANEAKWCSELNPDLGWVEKICVTWGFPKTLGTLQRGYVGAYNIGVCRDIQGSGFRVFPNEGYHVGESP